MSDRTQISLRNPQQLSEVILRGRLLPGVTPGLRPRALRLWRVWESPGSVLIGAQAGEEEPAEPDPLVFLENRFLLHFLRLLSMERRLHVEVQTRQGRDGRRTIRRVELERQRLGRELHTGVGQMLAAIRLQLELVARELGTPSSGVTQALGAISTLIADTMEQVRSITKRLHPPEWQRLSLESAIRQLWEISGVPQGFEASLQINPLPWEPHLEVKILMYRGLQEALSNLVRHSRATRISVTIKATSTHITLSIEDNGIGFDVGRFFGAPAHVGAGIGLRSLREMAQELGGRFEVESGRDGTKLLVSVVPFPVEA